MLLNSSELNGSNLNEMRLLAPIYDQAGGPYWPRGLQSHLRSCLNDLTTLQFSWYEREDFAVLRPVLA